MSESTRHGFTQAYNPKLPGDRERAETRCREVLAREAERLGLGYRIVPLIDRGDSWSGSFVVHSKEASGE